MLPAAVVVEIAPQDGASSMARVLLTTCSGAVRVPGGCVVEADTQRVRPEAIAIVSWSDAERRGARVEVGTQRAERSDWVSRDISFHPGDQEIERWRAVGLLIAALVGEVLQEPEASKGRQTGGSSAPPEQAPERHSWWFDGGFLLQARPAFFGVSVRPAHILGRNWLIAGRFDYADQAAPPGGVYLTWVGGGLGCGITSPLLPTVSVDARIEAVVRYLRATATLGGSSDRASEWGLGARFSASAAWMLSRPLGFFVGVSVLQMSSGVMVRVRGQTTERLPSLSGDLSAGVRLALP